MKPLLIIRTGSSYDDLPKLCQTRGDEVEWFSETANIPLEQIKTVSVYLGEALPNPEDVQAIIITGSIDMVTERLDWSERTATWIKDAVTKQVPILGVCFGHQLLAHAFGGEIGDNPNGAEFGTITVNKSASASTDKLFKDLPDSLNVQAFHFESILNLPEHAVVLASNDMDKHHAYRFGDNAWGVQFHPEFDQEIMDHAIDVYENMISDAGFNLKKLRAGIQESDHGKMLIQRFIALSFT